jgi:hypothetical protein
LAVSAEVRGRGTAAVKPNSLGVRDADGVAYDRLVEKPAEPGPVVVRAIPGRPWHLCLNLSAEPLTLRCGNSA